MARRIRGAGLAAVLCAAAAACGDDAADVPPGEDPFEETTTTVPDDVEPALLEVRPLLDETASADGSCPAGDVAHPVTASCLAVGEVVVDRDDVAEARAVAQSALADVGDGLTGDDPGAEPDGELQRWSVVLTLTDGGAESFATLATSCVEQDDRCPSGLAALIVDDEVLSVTGFVTTDFDGPLHLTGDFTEDEARELAAALTA